MATPGYYESLPKKRMGSGALFFDEQGKILIVKPSYKDDWEIPGGAIENNESPRNAAMREVKEELGLDVTLTNMLCVDYQDADGEKTESLMFIFDGGILTTNEQEKIVLPEKELLEYRFVTLEEAQKLLIDVTGRRVEQAVKAKEKGISVYLENRELV